MWCLKLIKTETKWPQFSGRHFQMHFLEWKCMNFFENFIECFPNGPINNIPVLVFIMSWRRPGDKPLSEPMMIILLTHICVTRGCDYLSWVDLSIRCNSVVANDVQGKHMLFYLYLVHKRLYGYMWKWCDWCSACMRTATMACGPTLMQPFVWWLHENTWRNHDMATNASTFWTSTSHLWIPFTKCIIRTLATSLVFILFRSINAHLTSLQL